MAKVKRTSTKRWENPLCSMCRDVPNSRCVALEVVGRKIKRGNGASNQETHANCKSWSISYIKQDCDILRAMCRYATIGSKRKHVQEPCCSCGMGGPYAADNLLCCVALPFLRLGVSKFCGI